MTKILFSCIFLLTFFHWIHSQVQPSGFLEILNPGFDNERFNTEKKTYIRGKVIDKMSNEPIIGAKIKISDRNTYSYTDLNGYFEFINLPPATYNIEVSYPTYQSLQFRNISTENQQIVNLMFSMRNANQQKGKETELEIVDSVISELPELSQYKKMTYISDLLNRNQSDKENFDVSYLTALRRLNSVVISENQGLQVRGMNERYNPVLLNGVPLLATDPDKTQFSAQFLPNIISPNAQIIKSASSHEYAVFGGGLISINTEDMPPAQQFHANLSFFYQPNSTFRELFSHHLTSKILFVSGIKKYRPDAVKPNFFSERTFTAPMNTHLGLHLNNRYNLLKNRDLGVSASISFYDQYNASNAEFQIPGYLKRDTLRSTALATGFQHSHRQIMNMVGNATLKLNSRHVIYTKNLLQWRNENSVHQYQNEHFLHRNHTFRRNLFFSHQNGGHHNLAATKNQNLRFEWYGFYHFYGINEPFSTPFSFETVNNQSLLAFATDQTSSQDLLYQRNLILSSKQNFHQYGGDFHFDAMIKEDDQKVKTKIGMFVNAVNRKGSSQTYQLRTTSLQDSTILNYASVMNGNFPENFLSSQETTDSSSIFRFYNYNFAPYLSVQYEISDVFNIIIGFREDIYLRKAISSAQQFRQVFGTELPSISTAIFLNSTSRLRASYCPTVLRPDDRELIGFSYFHPFYQMKFEPNSNLLPSTIQNLEFRFERNSEQSDHFSAGLYFKSIRFPMERTYFIATEQIQAMTARTVNVYGGFLVGAEFDVKQNIGNLFQTSDDFIQNLTIYWNAFLTKSEVKKDAQDKYFQKNSPMQGQAGYGTNVGISWAYKPWGFKILFFVNHKGKQLAFANPQGYNLWELARTELEVQTSKIFGKNWEIRISARNLTNSPIQFANMNHNLLFSQKNSNVILTHRLGQQFLLSLHYRL